jgi:hypothetical protein
MHNRRTIALINVLDWLLLSYAILILLSVFDTLDIYDAFLIAAHILHAFTAPLGYIIVRHVAPSSFSLRLVMLIYGLSIALDMAAFTMRLVLLTGIIAHAATLVAPTASGVRCLIALAFVCLDFCGAFFFDLAYQYTLVPERNDAQTLVLARKLAGDPTRILEESHARLGTKVLNVYDGAANSSPVLRPSSLV